MLLSRALSFLAGLEDPDLAILFTIFLITFMVMLVIINIELQKRFVIAAIGAFMTAFLVTAIGVALAIRGNNAAFLAVTFCASYTAILFLSLLAKVQAGLAFWMGIVVFVSALIGPLSQSFVSSVSRGVLFGAASILPYLYRQRKKRLQPPHKPRHVPHGHKNDQQKDRGKAD